MNKICHMTSAHTENDIRIFHKECNSLVQAGYSVFQVSFGEKSICEGVEKICLGNVPSGRLQRMTKAANQVYRKAKELDCDIYHFHDPELLPYGLKLKKLGKIVIFDSHEDVPAQILDKEYIPSFLRTFVSKVYRCYETFIVKRLDAVVAATPHIAETFINRASKVVVVNNYPKLNDIQFNQNSFKEREGIICYAGGLNRIRGEHIMLEAMRNVKGTLVLASNHPVATYDNVQYVGYLNRQGVNELYKKSVLGMVLYQPAANHLDAQPIKLFEFMAAGLPVVASDFELWRKIVEDAKCGICVDPQSVSQVADACNWLLNNREQAQSMGLNGRKAIECRYNWKKEEEKLLELYSSFKDN